MLLECFSNHFGFDCSDLDGRYFTKAQCSPGFCHQVVGVVATSGKIHADVLRAVHNRQLEDWAR